MLGKLFKYEIKATARLFIPLYLTLLVFTLINRLLLPLTNLDGQTSTFYGIATGIGMFLYVILMAGTMLVTLFVMIQRFYKNLLGDEGYLMFTLPVSSWKHILSKLVTSMGWTLISSLVACGSILILVSGHLNADFYRELSMVLAQIRDYLGTNSYLLVFEVILLALLSLATTILTIYGAISLGHLFNKYKLLVSFGMYLALNAASQMVMMLFSQIVSGITKHSLFLTGPSDISLFLFIAILYYCIATAGFFLLTNFVLKKKLNLE